MEKHGVPIFVNRRKFEVKESSLSARQILALVGLGEGYDLRLLKGEGDPGEGECLLADQAVPIRPGLHFRAVPGNCTFGHGG